MLKHATKFAPEHTSLERAYVAGFRHAELFLDQEILARWTTVAEQARDYPFTYALHFPNRLDLPAGIVEAAVGLYESLDCRCMVIHQPQFDKFHKALLALQPTLRLAIENHKLTPEQFIIWSEGSSGLTLDVEHMWKFTYRDCPLRELLAHLEMFLARHADRLFHVHLPGYWPGFAEHRPQYCSRDMVFPVLSLLHQARFEGLIVSEVNPPFQNPLDLRMDTLLFDCWRAQQG
jgi:hypothetical protein